MNQPKIKDRKATTPPEYTCKVQLKGKIKKRERAKDNKFSKRTATYFNSLNRQSRGQKNANYHS